MCEFRVLKVSQQRTDGVACKLQLAIWCAGRNVEAELFHMFSHTALSLAKNRKE